MIKNFVTQAEMKAAIAALEEKYHGVDDIYIQVSGAQEPANKWGGAWELVSQGRMLIGASDDYPLGSTGGEATHTLVAQELPNLKGQFEDIAIQDLNQVTAGGIGVEGICKGFQNGGYVGYGTSTAVSSGQTAYDGVIIEFGNDQPHNNMPPYLAVNIWRKISD